MTALAVIADADEETLHAELVGTCDVEQLVAWAVVQDEAEFAGLDRYGYTKKKQGYEDRYVK